MDALEYVAARIKAMRNEVGLSQEALAKELKVATNTLSRWETGAYKPGIDDLEKLARYFKTSILNFFPPAESGDNRAVKVEALLRAVSDLKDEDVDDLQQYAEFRKARSLYKKAGRPRGGSNKAA